MFWVSVFSPFAVETLTKPSGINLFDTGLDVKGGGERSPHLFKGCYRLGSTCIRFVSPRGHHTGSVTTCNTTVHPSKKQAWSWGHIRRRTELLDIVCFRICSSLSSLSMLSNSSAGRCSQTQTLQTQTFISYRFCGGFDYFWVYAPVLNRAWGWGDPEGHPCMVSLGS